MSEHPWHIGGRVYVGPVGSEMVGANNDEMTWATEKGLYTAPSIGHVTEVCPIHNEHAEGWTYTVTNPPAVPWDWNLIGGNDE